MTNSVLLKKLEEKNIEMTNLFICETANGEKINVSILSDSYYSKGYVLEYKNEYYPVRLGWHISPEISYISLERFEAEKVFTNPMKTDLIKIKIVSFGDHSALNAHDSYNSGSVMAQITQFVNIETISSHIKVSTNEKLKNSKTNAEKQVSKMVGNQKEYKKGTYAYDYFIKGFDYAEEGELTGV